eukprot:1713110-Pyramimonas_sp.AAC.1
MGSDTIWPRSWLFVSVVSDEPTSPDPYAGNSHWTRSLMTEQSYEKNDSTEERKTNKGGEVSVT